MNYPNYSTNAMFGPIPLWAFIIGVIAAFILIFSYLYGAIKTYQTKDTSQISLWMWIIVIFGAVSLDIFFLLGIVLTKGSLSFSLMFALETITIIFAAYIFITKIKNMCFAKKLKITEKEYCQILIDKINAKKKNK